MDIVSKKDYFKVRVCRNLFSQGRGWMFRFFIKEDGLLFDLHETQLFPLHMFFVFRKLDIAYINSDFVVVSVLKNVKPFMPYVRGVEARYIAELKNSKSLKKGDRLTFVG
jgi:uncharacterized membrane protein (UPF0127 family)